MTLTKASIVDNICKNTDLNSSQAARTVESLLEIIKSRLESGDAVLISRFGKFQVKAKNERRGRNPHTGDDLMLEPRRVVSFLCSGVLRDKMNGKE